MKTPARTLLATALLLAFSPMAVAALSDGLMAYYPMNGDAADASGNGNHGTLHGGVTATSDAAGQTNGALAFNGVDAYISVPDAPSLHAATDQMTITFWGRLDQDNTVVAPILHKGGPEGGCAENREYALYTYYGGWHFTSTPAGGCQEPLVGGHYPQGKWMFFVGVLDRVNGVSQIYVNNVKQLEMPIAPGPFRSNSDEMWIGYWQEGGTHPPPAWPYFQGALDELRIYDRLLSLAERKALFNRGIPVHGEVLSLGTHTVTCTNLKTGQSVTIPAAIKPNWDCEAAGLQVKPGQTVQVRINGKAQ